MKFFISNGVGFILTIIILVSLWYYDARLLTEFFDFNQRLIRSAANLFEGSYAQYGYKAEVALRMINGERMFVFAEISFVVKLCIWMLSRGKSKEK